MSTLLINAVLLTLLAVVTIGIINQRGGSFVVNNGLTDGGGTTTLNVEKGTFTVTTGGLSVDGLQVARNGWATLTVNGGTLKSGTGTTTFVIDASGI